LKKLHFPLEVILEVENSAVAIHSDLQNNCPKRKHIPKKKILLVGPLPPTVGGITTFISNILKSSLKEKYTFITFGTHRPTFGLTRKGSDYAVALRIGPSFLAKSVISTLCHLLKFPLILLKDRPHIVHICTASYWPFWENSLYLLLSKIFKKKVIFHIHGGGFDNFYRKSNRFAKYIISKTLNLSDRIIVLSPTWKNILADYIPQNKTGVLNNFINFSQYNRMKKKAGLLNKQLKVLFIGGAGAKQKGFYDLVKAIPQVTKNFENIIFLLVACSDIKEINALLQSEEMSSHTKVMGYLTGNDKIEAFVSSDIFVLPSYVEGLPFTLLEAMAAGLPIITTPVGAIPDVIREGKNGFFVKPGDYETLAKKILFLAQNEKLREKMGEINQETILKQYDESVVTTKLDNEYCQLQ
jgi:glycosyltransferase involved in cell wall biosynthesis